MRIRSSDPRAAPAILGNYLEAEEDRTTLVRGIKLLRRLFATDARKPYVAAEIAPGAGISSDEDYLAYAKARGSSYHTAGTCRMGMPTSSMCVVDQRLRVHGVTALRVVDASIMPAIVSGNTNATSIMIGEKGAAMVAEGCRRLELPYPRARVRLVAQRHDRN